MLLFIILPLHMLIAMMCAKRWYRNHDWSCSTDECDRIIASIVIGLFWLPCLTAVLFRRWLQAPTLRECWVAECARRDEQRDQALAAAKWRRDKLNTEILQAEARLEAVTMAMAEVQSNSAE